MKKKLLLSILILTLVFTCVEPAMAIDESEHQRDVYNYLSNWSYNDNDSIYSINMDALTAEQLNVFYNAAPNELDDLIMDFAYNQFATYLSDSYAVMPCVSGGGTNSLTFTFEDDSKTLSYSYTISAIIASSDGLVTSISGETCSISIPYGSELTYSNFSHVFSIGIGTSRASIGFSAKFRVYFGSMYVDKWDSMVSSFYA